MSHQHSLVMKRMDRLESSGNEWRSETSKRLESLENAFDEFRGSGRGYQHRMIDGPLCIHVARILVPPATNLGIWRLCQAFPRFLYRWHSIRRRRHRSNPYPLGRPRRCSCFQDPPRRRHRRRPCSLGRPRRYSCIWEPPHRRHRRRPRSLGHPRRASIPASLRLAQCIRDDAYVVTYFH